MKSHIYNFNGAPNKIKEADDTDTLIDSIYDKNKLSLNDLRSYLFIMNVRKSNLTLTEIFEKYENTYLPVGRYINTNISYINMNKTIRSMLISNLYYEIDIESCYFAIIRNLISIRNLDLKTFNLDIFLKHKKDLIAHFKTMFPNKPEMFKVLFLGSLCMSIKNFTYILNTFDFKLPMIPNYNLSDLYSGLCIEVALFKVKFVEAFNNEVPLYICGKSLLIISENYNDDLIKLLSLKDPMIRYKLYNSLLVRICSTYESEIIGKLIKYMQANGFTVGDYLYDGLLIEKNKDLTVDTLKDACKYIKDETGFDININIK
jgi:hypothetical protein